MDNLKIQELRMELEKRGLSTARKRKPELERNFDELRRGILNVPALLQGAPETPLVDLCLDKYEISPVEPLHDLKGHLSNLIDELRVALTGKVKEKVEVIVSSVLGKETLRGSDYRKGAILILEALQDLTPTSSLTTMLATAVEMTELLYCDPTKRTSQSVLHSVCACQIMLRSLPQSKDNVVTENVWSLFPCTYNSQPSLKPYNSTSAS